MSVNANWDIDKHRDFGDNEDHWQLRRKFMERWKSVYPENKLVTLSKVFINMEFKGHEYSPDLAAEVAWMAKEIIKEYNEMKNPQLQHTSITSTDAKEEYSQGTKREGGAFVNESPKRLKMVCARSDEAPAQEDKEDILGAVLKELAKSSATCAFPSSSATGTETPNVSEEQEPTAGCSSDETKKENETIDYMQLLSRVRCVAATNIAEHMFNTKFGRLVLLARSWENKLWNIQTSCQLCGLRYEYNFNEMTNACSLMIEGKMVARGRGPTEKLSKKRVEDLAWEVLTNEAITILVKELCVPKEELRYTFTAIWEGRQPGPREDVFGAPVEASMAARLIHVMGEDLGADAQGNAVSARPHMQIIYRAGMGHVNADLRQIRNAADSLFRRYIASECIDLDLIFSTDFTKVERAAVHQAAWKAQLQSRSYSQGSEKFLVVKKKIDVFNLAQAVVKKGGSTPKYKVFIPAKVASFYRERE